LKAEDQVRKYTTIQLAGAIFVVLHKVQLQIHFELACNCLVQLIEMLPWSKYSIQQKAKINICKTYFIDWQQS
jgi:hypothetical protein